MEQTQNAANRAAEAAEAEQQAPLEAAISGSSGDIAAVDAPKEQHSEPATEPELEACASDASGDSKEAGGDALDHPVPDAEANETGDGDEDDPDESDFDDSETFEFDEESAQSMVAEVVFEGAPGEDPRDTLKAVIEGIIYITDEPLTVDQIAAALDQPADLIQELFSQLTEE